MAAANQAESSSIRLNGLLVRGDVPLGAGRAAPEGRAGGERVAMLRGGSPAPDGRRCITGHVPEDHRVLGALRPPRAAGEAGEDARGLVEGFGMMGRRRFDLVA